MKNKIPTINNLTTHEYYSSKDTSRFSKILKGIQKDPYNPYHIIVPKYGIGKSTTIVSGMEEGDIFFCDTNKQVRSKIEDFERCQNLVVPFFKDIPKYNHLPGKLHYLGYKKDRNGNIERATEDLPEEIHFYKDGSMETRNLSKERQKPYVQTIINDMEMYGVRPAWNYHSDKDIIEWYGKMWSEETRERVVTFSPTTLFTAIREMDKSTVVGDMAVDEGGENTSVGKNFIPLHEIASKLIKQDPTNVDLTDPSTYDVKDFSVDTDPHNIPIPESPYITATEVLLEFYQNMYDSILKKKHTRTDHRGRKLVDFYLKDVISDKDWSDLMDTFEHLTDKNYNGQRYVDIEMKENSDIDSICFIDDLISWFDRLVASDGVKLLAFIDDKKVDKIDMTKSIYIDIFESATGEKRAFIPHASIGKNYVDYLHQELIPNNHKNQFKSPPNTYDKSESPNIVGENMDISTIDISKLETNHKVYKWAGKSSVRKSCFTTKDYRMIVDLIDRLGNQFVTSPNTGKKYDKKNNEMNTVEISSLYDNAEHINFAKAEGESTTKDTHVHGSRRLSNTDIWGPIWEDYKELLPKFSDKERKKLIYSNNGRQVGYHNPENVINGFQYDNDFKFNPLQDWWQRFTEREVIEKLFRKRNQEDESGVVYRLGINPILDVKGKKSRYIYSGFDGDRIDYMCNLFKQLPMEEKAKFIIDWDVTGKLASNLVQYPTTMYIKEVSSGNTSKLSLKKENYLYKLIEEESEGDEYLVWEELKEKIPFDISPRTVNENWSMDFDFKNQYSDENETMVRN